MNNISYSEKFVLTKWNYNIWLNKSENLIWPQRKNNFANNFGRRFDSTDYFPLLSAQPSREKSFDFSYLHFGRQPGVYEKSSGLLAEPDLAYATDWVYVCVGNNFRIIRFCSSRVRNVPAHQRYHLLHFHPELLDDFLSAVRRRTKIRIQIRSPLLVLRALVHQ